MESLSDAQFPTEAELSDARLAANRANARRSTGPRTPEGRARSSANSFKHGLTARKVHLAAADKDDYEAHTAALLAELRPSGVIELSIAQIISDAYWRLSRVRSIEEIMHTLAPPDPIPAPEPFDPRAPYRPEPIDPRTIAVESPYPPTPPPDPDLLDAARAWLQKPNAFANIALYEGRLQRQIKLQTEELLRLRRERQLNLERRFSDATDHHRFCRMKSLPFNPADLGFVFSKEDFERARLLELRRHEVSRAKKLGFNLAEYEKLPVPNAA